MTDQTLELQWWEAVRKRDDKLVFDRLYHYHWESLYATAWNRTRDEAVSQDIVQEVFISFWIRRKEIVLRTSVAQYLAGALKNRLIDYFQSEEVKQRVLTHVMNQMDTVLHQTVDSKTYQEIEDILDEEISKMPDNMRQSFLLKLENVATSEIAKRLNLAEQTVSNLLSEASKRLRKNLPPRFEERTFHTLMITLQVIHDFLTNR